MEIACAARSCSDQPGLKPPVAKEQSVTPGAFSNPWGALMGNTKHFLFIASLSNNIVTLFETCFL